jgi:hypothetical protein
MFYYPRWGDTRLPTLAGRQVIELKPGFGGEPRTRPLKTGKNFVLVVRLPRVHQLSWDRASYDPGETCRLTLTGSGLGGKPLEVIVEAEGAAGVWTAVARVKAAVEGDQSTAVAEWKFPVPPGYAEHVAARAAAARGNLVDARWGNTEPAHGDPLEVHVEAQSMESAALLCLVEREEPDGTWRHVAQLEGSIRDGKCRMAWHPPPPLPESFERPSAELIACRFEDGVDLTGAHTAWLHTQGTKLDGALADFVLEEEQPDGRWASVGKALSSFKAGRARAGIVLPSAVISPARATPPLLATASGALRECRFEDGTELAAGQTAWLVAHCEGLEGAALQVVLEREERDGRWEPVGNAVSTVKAGRARAGIPLLAG